MDSGSGITAMSEELVKALQEQVGMKLTALMQACVTRARVGTSLGQESNIETHSCPLHLAIKRHGNQSGLPCRLPCSLEKAMWLSSGRIR